MKLNVQYFPKSYITFITFILFVKTFRIRSLNFATGICPLYPPPQKKKKNLENRPHITYLLTYLLSDNLKARDASASKNQIDQIDQNIPNSMASSNPGPESYSQWYFIVLQNLERLHFMASASKYVIIQFWHDFKRDTVAVGGSFGAMTLTILHLILLFPIVFSIQDSLSMRVRYIFN